MLMLDNVIIFLFVRMFLRIKSHSNYCCETKSSINYLTKSVLIFLFFSSMLWLVQPIKTKSNKNSWIWQLVLFGFEIVLVPKWVKRKTLDFEITLLGNYHRLIWILFTAKECVSALCFLLLSFQMALKWQK